MQEQEEKSGVEQLDKQDLERLARKVFELFQEDLRTQRERLGPRGS
jgi:hypothetical protein